MTPTQKEITDLATTIATDGGFRNPKAAVNRINLTRMLTVKADGTINQAEITRQLTELARANPDLGVRGRAAGLAEAHRRFGTPTDAA